MLMQLTPMLAGLEAARAAAIGVIHSDDEVTMDDQGDRWVFEFIPTADTLGGGARVAVAKADLRILSVTRSQ
jgi:hypothetical protein